MKKRKRYSKPHHFFGNAKKHPESCLAEVFKNFHLEDLRREINLWQHLALSNDQSAYDEGSVREDMMDFIQELHRLIEAFHIINEKNNLQKNNDWTKGLSKQTKKILSGMNNPVSQTAEEKDRPNSVIKHFCKTFRRAYAKMELLDLLDAVIIYDGDKKVYKGNQVLFYQHLHYLIKLAYNMNKNKMFIKH